jgi:Uncharacterized protein conserved in bacteria (DUF2188)
LTIFAIAATKKRTNLANAGIRRTAIVRVQADLICHWEMHMAKLAKYTLSHDAKTKRWVLKNDGTGQTVKSFASKAGATKGGVLERAVGKEGSVKIKKRNGKVQEERTYPRGRDPRVTKG